MEDTVAAAKAKEAEEAAKMAEAQNLATWQLLGGDDSHAWLLTETQVRV